MSLSGSFFNVCAQEAVELGRYVTDWSRDLEYIPPAARTLQVFRNNGGRFVNAKNRGHKGIFLDMRGDTPVLELPEDPDVTDLMHGLWAYRRAILKEVAEPPENPSLLTMFMEHLVDEADTRAMDTIALVCHDETVRRLILDKTAKAGGRAIFWDEEDTIPSPPEKACLEMEGLLGDFNNRLTEAVGNPAAALQLARNAFDAVVVGADPAIDNQIWDGFRQKIYRLQDNGAVPQAFGPVDALYTGGLIWNFGQLHSVGIRADYMRDTHGRALDERMYQQAPRRFFDELRQLFFKTRPVDVRGILKNGPQR